MGMVVGVHRVVEFGNMPEVFAGGERCLCGYEVPAVSVGS